MYNYSYIHKMKYKSISFITISSYLLGYFVYLSFQQELKLSQPECKIIGPIASVSAPILGCYQRIILLIYMSKFHKTTYNRQQNFNAISSSHGRRNPLYQQPNCEWSNPIKMEHPLDRKMDIESSLLITHKNQQRVPVRPIESAIRKVNNKSEGKFYETAVGFTNARDRPQSKQEPRPKPQMEGKIKTEALLPDRPQTSKGVRNIRSNVSEVRERQTSQNDEEIPIQVRITEKKPRNVQSSYSRRSSNNHSNIMNFETSIDPEFLSLFAN